MTKNIEPPKTLTVSQWLSEIEKEYGPANKIFYTEEHEKLIVALKAKGFGSRRIADIFKKKFGFGNREKIVMILRKHMGKLDSDDEIYMHG